MLLGAYCVLSVFKNGGGILLQFEEYVYECCFIISILDSFVVCLVGNDSSDTRVNL